MPKLEDITKNVSPLGIALGLGAAVVVTAIVPALPTLIRAGRPTARAALNSGLVLLERGREVVAEASEEFEDILAEVKAELQQERKAQAADFRDAEVVIKPRKDP